MNNSNYLLLFINVIITFSNAAKKEYLLPNNFGNYSLSELSSAPSCGTTMATYNSVPAKSNGAEQGTYRS